MTFDAEVANLNWLVDSFVRSIPGVIDAIVISADGLLMAMSRGIEPAAGDQLASVGAGLISLAAGGSRCFDAGGVRQVIVEIEVGYMFFMGISNGSLLAVIANRDVDVAATGYEMTMVCKRVGTALTPALMTEIGSTTNARH